MTAAARLHLWHCKTIFPLGTCASSPCHCLPGHGVLQGTCPAARVQCVRSRPSKVGQAGESVVTAWEHGSPAVPVPQVCFKGVFKNPRPSLDSCKAFASRNDPTLTKSSSALLPPQTRTYLDSLVVTRAESWFAASQSQASACAASPPSCSLMHLQDRAVQRWLPSEPSPFTLPFHRCQLQSHPSQDYSQATATN